jgi:hypothetical protein
MHFCDQRALEASENVSQIHIPANTAFCIALELAGNQHSDRLGENRWARSVTIRNHVATLSVSVHSDLPRQGVGAIKGGLRMPGFRGSSARNDGSSERRLAALRGRLRSP